MNRYRIAVVAICLNEPYWQFLNSMIESAKKFFLRGHEVDFIVWSDMPENSGVKAKVIPTEPFKWPLPTLYRYHLFLKEEQLLNEYDYIYYVDADMKFVSRVGDEVLGNLVGAQHPMYRIRNDYNPPYEPNENSTAFIPRVGKVLEKDGKKKFEQMYFAGGFQGGRADRFIQAMKTMREKIDEDFTKNGYIAIWNDESHWNRYLFENSPDVILSPSYVYPDSLVKSYYRKAWGRDFVPKLVSITKKFSLTKEGGMNIHQTLKNL